MNFIVIMFLISGVFTFLYGITLIISAIFEHFKYNYYNDLIDKFDNMFNTDNFIVAIINLLLFLIFNIIWFPVLVYKLYNHIKTTKKFVKLAQETMLNIKNKEKFYKSLVYKKHPLVININEYFDGMKIYDDPLIFKPIYIDNYTYNRIKHSETIRLNKI